MFERLKLINRLNNIESEMEHIKRVIKGLVIQENLDKVESRLSTTEIKLKQIWELLIEETPVTKQKKLNRIGINLRGRFRK